MNVHIAQPGVQPAPAEAGRRLTWLHMLAMVNLGLVVIQAVSAGSALSGYGIAATMHSRVAMVLGLGVLAQAVASIVMWRRGRMTGRMAGGAAVLFLLVVVQIAAGHSRRYWLHVPLGVALVGALAQQSRATRPERG